MITATESDKLLTGTAVAKRLGVSHETIRLWRQQRGLPFIRLNKTAKYRWGDVQRWLDQSAHNNK